MPDIPIVIRRTAAANNPPPNGSLEPGMLNIEMNDPVRLWVGVDPDLDPAGHKLLIDKSAPAGANLWLGPNPPTDPAVYPFWFDDAQLYVFDGNAWVIAVNPPPFPGGSAAGASMNYSLDEQVVGTWIDGRSVYQKTFLYTSHGNQPHNIANVDQAIAIEGMDTGGWGLNPANLSFNSATTAGWPGLIATVRYIKNEAV